MKKILVLLMSLILIMSFAACGDSSSDADQIEMKAEQIKGVNYSIPSEWEKKEADVSGALAAQNMYYPDPEDTTDAFDAKLFTIEENEIYSLEQAENYMDLFMSSMFAPKNGYETVECEKYGGEAVPARHGIFKMNNSAGEIIIDTYCYMASSKEVFVLSYWHADSSKRDFSEEFMQIVNSVDIADPEFDKTEQ